MIARQTAGPEANDPDGDQATKQRAEKRPAAFMFIDSSNGGINAKPNKAVRSFVMKSARTKKSWSTRPKSPDAEHAANTKPRKQPSSRIQGCDSEQLIRRLPRLKCNTPSEPQENHTTASPSSSRSGSVFSSHGGNWTYESPVSNYTSPYAEYDHAKDAYHISNFKPTTLPRQIGANIGTAKPFGHLPVSLDLHTERLLSQRELDTVQKL